MKLLRIKYHDPKCPGLRAVNSATLLSLRLINLSQVTLGNPGSVLRSRV